ncbi:DUF5629 family protein [Pseudomonas fluvialis]|uniref:DUF5629 family protein n=1 Tax=Pseudomonas fluvialis TaxID=1793966 RepID=UPI001B68C249|nr:DUF5629 family protein [Pseudomonas sp.]
MPMTLCEALQSADLLLIDDLHAWQFHYAPSGEPALRIDCQDGSQARHWQFNQAELAAAQYDPGEDCWRLASHRLQCLGAFSGDNLDSAEGSDSSA